MEVPDLLDSTSSTSTAKASVNVEPEPSDTDTINVNEEMADMVPLAIKSDLPQLQGQVNNLILACPDFTWEEFFKLFIAQPHSEYVMKGVAGRDLLFESKIEDYIRTFKRKQKVYPVTIEKLKKPKEKNSPNVPKPEETKKKRVRSPRKRKKKESKAKDSSKRKKVEQPSVPADTGSNKKFDAEQRLSQSQPKDRPLPPPHVQTASTGTQLRSGAPSIVQSSGHSAGPNLSINQQVPIIPLRSIMKNSTTPTEPKQPKVNCSIGGGVLSVGSPYNFVPIAQHSVTTFSQKQTFLRGNQQFYSRTEGSGQQQLDVDSSDDESIIARNPRLYNNIATRPNLKPALLQFLINKVSNRDMLKVRDELMKLKEQDDYFKLTSLTPLAAGLLDQMLCRNPTGHTG